MIINIKNMTAHPQQVMFCDGSGKTIMPEQAIDIEEGKFYKEELVRIKRFFEISLEQGKSHTREVKVLPSKK